MWRSAAWLAVSARSEAFASFSSGLAAGNAITGFVVDVGMVAVAQSLSPPPRGLPESQPGFTRCLPRRPGFQGKFTPPSGWIADGGINLSRKRESVEIPGEK